MYLIYAILLKNGEQHNKCISEYNLIIGLLRHSELLFQFIIIWHSSTNKYYLKMAFCNLNILLLGVFVNSVVTTPILTPITIENVEASNDGRECKLLKDSAIWNERNHGNIETSDTSDNKWHHTANMRIEYIYIGWWKKVIW